MNHIRISIDGQEFEAYRLPIGIPSTMTPWQLDGVFNEAARAGKEVELAGSELPRWDD